MLNKDVGKKIHLYLAGDSTVAANYAKTFPQAGWGQMLAQFFSSDVAVINCALNGRSSRSFIEEGRLAEICRKLAAGDYFFIQFGHNDAKTDARHTDPFTTYKKYLKAYIDAAREAQAVPVLITSVQCLTFNRDGTIENIHREYHEAARELAIAENTALLALGEKSKALLEELGPEAAQKLFMHLAPGEFPNYPEGKQDDTHLRVEGAEAMAQLVALEIKEIFPESLAQFLLI
jgi:lysophospholipase L1-like esterase